MADTSSKNNVARIREDGSQVVLHPNDNDLFVRTGRQVIEACQLRISIDLWMKEFTSMLAEVYKWSASHADLIETCYCASNGSRVEIFFSPKSGHFEFGLADELVNLNAQLLNKFNVGNLECHQAPFDELERFLHTDSAILIYGLPIGPSEAVEA